MRKVLVVLAVLAMAGAAYAEGPAGTVELTPTIGYWFGDTLVRGTTGAFDFDVTIDDAPAYGVRLGYRFNPHWSLEGYLGYEKADLVTGKDELFGGSSRLGTMKMSTGEVGFLGSFGHSRLVPFLAGGIGAMHLSPNLNVAGKASGDTRFVGYLGTGFKLYFTPELALRFDWRGHSVNVANRHDRCDWWDHCDNNHNWITFQEVALGLSFVF